MFAYASGSSREWRLGAAMNAIAMSLPPQLIRSIALLVSPTTCPMILPESAEQAERAYAERPLWQSALHVGGLLPAPGHYSAHGVRIGLCTVSIQGLSYQAAQYISKLATAETFALHGTDPRADAARPVTVSANVAGITRTRSLSHPLFEAAFIGAPRFGVRIFDSPTTRALSGLLTCTICSTRPHRARRRSSRAIRAPRPTRCSRSRCTAASTACRTFSSTRSARRR